MAATSNTETRDRDRDAKTIADVNAALTANKLPRAITLAKAAIADGLQNPLLHNLIAFELEEQGRLEDALAELEKAYKLAPLDVLILNAMGANLVRQARTEAALKIYDVALKIAPDLPQTHFNKAEALSLRDEFDQARVCVERALQLYPDYASALSLLAWLVQKELPPANAPAGELATRALSLNLNQPLASLVLAEIEIGQGRLAEAEARLKTLLEQANLADLLRARAHGFLADVLDRQERPAEAFAAYSAGNEVLRRLHAPQYAAEGAPTVLEMAEWLADYFDKADPAFWTSAPVQPPSAPDEPARHVFLVGFPRSGTTLLENVLASHPSVINLDEREILIGAARDLFVTAPGLDQLAIIDGAEAAARRSEYWRQAREYHPDLAGKTFIDKLPLNTVQLPVIAKLFPKAKLLFAVRDPRDVVFSCFRRRFGMNPAMYQLLTLDGAARYYDAIMKLAEIYKSRLNLDIHPVRYENVVEDLRTEAGAVCDFIGLEWDDAMLDFAEQSKSRPIRTPSANQVRRGIYSEGKDQWRPYAAELAPVAPLLQPWVAHFGYPRD